MADRRYPNTLQGLLKFAMENTKSEDATGPSNYEAMDPERKKFLEEALKSMTVDVMEEFQKALSVVEDENNHNTDDQNDAMNIIRDYVDNIDMANNFINIGGSKIIINKLKSNNPKLRTTSAYIIAEMSQNNPFSQKHFIDSDVLPTLISYLTNESEDVASSSMHCISSLIRQFEPGCVIFLELGGLECVLGCLSSEYSKVFIKTCFLISTLATEYDLVRDQFIQLGAVEKLSHCVDSVTGFDIKTESVLAALNVLVQTDEGKAKCRKTNISRCLKTIINNNADKAECEEMIEYSKNLLSCFSEDSTQYAER